MVIIETDLSNRKSLASESEALGVDVVLKLKYARNLMKSAHLDVLPPDEASIRQSLKH